MPKDGRIKYHPNFKKNNTSFQKLIFSVLTKPRFRSRKTSSFATTGWWPRSLEVMDLFSSHPRGGGPFFGRDELKGAKGGSYTYPGFDQHILVGFFLFEVLVFFLVGTSEKNHLEIGKRSSEKNEAINFLHVEVLWQVFQGNLSVCDVCAVFLWWRKRKGGCIPARYHKKTVGIHG